MVARPWREAWANAAYGADGFARRERPVRHFRTSAHVGAPWAEAVARLAALVGARDIVDVGSGAGELLLALHRLDPDRFRLTGVEVAPRPPWLPEPIRWCGRLDEVPPVEGLLLGNEWLDDVPVDVVVDGHLLLVDDDGTERLGPAATLADLAWLARWMPGTARAEVGRPRDDAWAAAVARVRRGLAIAVDYPVPEPSPTAAGGTLTGFRGGREVPPRPDGSCNLTAHVHLRACAVAGRRAGADVTLLTSQREALRALGVIGARPPVTLAGTDPPAYAAALQRAGEAAELTDRDGLGRLAWLVQAVDIPLPLPLDSLARRVVTGFPPHAGRARPTVEGA